MVLSKNLKSAFHTVNVGGAFYFCMKKEFIDLTGQKFGRLTVVEFSSLDKNKNAIFKCFCDCGNISFVRSGHLRRELIISCGCYQIERQSNIFKHGEARHDKRTKEYRAWKSMKVRCYNPKNTSYVNYGAKGITVCEMWRYSYENFLADVGRAPSDKHSLDRWPNPYGNYEPNNVRWAISEEQANNKTNNIILEYNGEKLTIAQWARKFGVPYNRIQNHITRDKKTIEQVIKKFFPLYL